MTLRFKNEGGLKMKQIVLRIFLIIILPLLVFSQNKMSTKFIPGEVILKVKWNLIELPLEVYGLYITYNNNEIQIDSVNYQDYKEGTRFAIKRRLRMDFKKFKEKNPEVAKKIKVKIPEGLLKLLKKYKVYHIERNAYAFAPEDTLPHPVQTRFGEKIVRSENYNKYLLFEFDKSKDVKEFCKELEKLKYVIYANPNYEIIEFRTPEDTW